MKQKNNHMKIVKSDFSKSDNIKSIDISIEDENATIDFNLILTKHAFERLSQRGITPKVISLAYIVGTEYPKQGCIFYVLNRSPYLSNIKELEKNQELVVIVSNFNQIVVTAYWAKNSNSQVKKKDDYYDYSKKRRA